MRKIDFVAGLVIACGGAGVLGPSPAGATYLPPAERELFQYCCKGPQIKCCSYRGCEIDESKCIRL